MRKILQDSLIRSNFPSWMGIQRSADIIPSRIDFNLIMHPEVHSYNPRQHDTNAEFREAECLIRSIGKRLGDHLNHEMMQTYYKFNEDTMVRVIYGSNMQENAGLDYPETKRLCMQVFAGEHVDSAAIEPRSPEYKQSREHLHRHNRESEEKHVVRARREVIQHAQALKYLVDAALCRDQLITQDLIKKTHHILCQGIGLEGATAYEQEPYAGVYRTIHVSAGTTCFCAPERVPTEMEKFVEGFNDDVRDREQIQELDPFYLAADACQDFVTIHPFRDGNGRMCRLLLNAYLIRYAGVMAPIGEQENDRKEYLDLARLAGDLAMEDDEDGLDNEQEAKLRLSRFVMERATGSLRDLAAKLQVDVSSQ